CLAQWAPTVQAPAATRRARHPQPRLADVSPRSSQQIQPQEDDTPFEAGSGSAGDSRLARLRRGHDMVPREAGRGRAARRTGSGPEGSSPNEFRHGSLAGFPLPFRRREPGLGSPKRAGPGSQAFERSRLMDGTKHDPSATSYRVLARKYRPQSFADLIGQEPMVQTLTNAFRLGRIAQAYMLTGVRGVGKTTTARILARALNYSVPGKVDQPTIDMTELGEHCQAIMEGRHIDVIEMDAASHTGIDDIREIIEAVRYKPAIA